MFSAALSARRRTAFDAKVQQLGGNQLFLAAQTIAELRFGALAAGWGEVRRSRLETAIATTTVVPVTDALITTVAKLRAESQSIGHPLAARSHNGDLWIAAAAIHLGSRLLTADRIFEDVPRLVLA